MFTPEPAFKKIMLLPLFLVSSISGCTTLIPPINTNSKSDSWAWNSLTSARSSTDDLAKSKSDSELRTQDKGGDKSSNTSSNSGTAKAKSSNSTSANIERIANPPARTIRFDGHEAILGNGIASSITTTELRARLKPLLERNKIQSANRVILQNGESSERLLAERWATDATAKDIQLIADSRSKRSGATAKTNWLSLLKVASEFPDVAQEYQRQRNAFALALQTGDPDEPTVQLLKKACTAVGHPIVEMDCLRLLGLRAVVSEQWDNANNLYRQGLAVASRSNNMQYQADLHLLLAEAAKRNDVTTNEVRSLWLEAIDNQIEIMKQSPGTLDIEFWLRIEQVLADTKTWPESLPVAFSPLVVRILESKVRSADVLFWSAIAQAQIDRSEMQLALLNLKKAETFASGDDVMWLRIAESKCLASIGQAEAAVAILSGPAISPQARIAAAATAALGSVKLQSGAYQQGATLLNKALKKSDAQWPSKPQAVADLALSQLIIGSTDLGLASLHDAQALFQANDDLPSLLQSLENEQRLLAHEGRDHDSTVLQVKIQAIELR